MKILTILGDSLAIVRPEDKIFEKDLYAYKIQERLGTKLYVINKAVKGNSTETENQLEAFVYHIRAASSSFFIIHLGIVDCSPRIFTRNEKEFLKIMLNIPVIKKIVQIFIYYKSSNRLKYTKKRKITDVSIKDYEENMNSLINKIRNTNPIEHIFLINIVYPGEYLLSRSYGIEENIKQFNKVLEKIASQNPALISLIDINAYTQNHPEYIIGQGHHISSEVHNFITNSVVSTMLKYL